MRRIGCRAGAAHVMLAGVGNERRRFSLVVASQCEAMGERLRIARLAEAAQGLDAVLRDPLRGACEAGLGDGRSLLIDQDRMAVYTAVAEAAQHAAGAGGLLILVWIGHGMAANEDFYVLPQGSVTAPGHPKGPYHLTQHLKEILAQAPGLELMVLIDACFSGDAAVQAAGAWARLNGDGRRRFQVLSAANLDERAWDCAFTRALTVLLRRGDITAGDPLHLLDLKRAAERASRKQQPVLEGWNGERGRDSWVSRNAALLQKAGSLLAFSRADLPALRAGLRYFQPPPALPDVVRASCEHAYVVLRGHAGCGKTTLLGALCHPEVSGGAVPEAFVHGLRLLKLHESAARVASDLAAQLDVTVEGFASARTSFKVSMPQVQWENTPETEQALLGPLRHLPASTLVRIALDGFDQLSDTSAADIADLIDRLRGLPPDAADVKVVVSSRPGAAPPDADTEIVVDAATDTQIRAYLHLNRQEIREPLFDAIVERSGGSWLVASLLADHARATPVLEPDDVPRGLSAVYERAFDDGLEGGARWDENDCPERALFTVLAAAGPGAVLPVPLLLDACARLGAPHVTETWLRTALPAPLRRFLIRAPVGKGETATVLYGLFHQSVADYLSHETTRPYTVDTAAGHQSIAAAIAELAPVDQRTPVTARHPLQDYAERAESHHLWHSGSHTQALGSLEARASTNPADNLRRWQRWHDEALRMLGPDHPDTLATRGNIARWMGETGDVEQALELDTALLADLLRVLGPDHPETLTVRNNVAEETGQAGDLKRALTLHTESLSDRIRVLGPDHPDTLTTRGNIAGWTGEMGDAERALALHTELLSDRIRVLGPDHRDTLTTRGNVASWTAEAGDVERALELDIALLADQLRVLGPDHPDTLTTRGNIATGTGEAGDLKRALVLHTELLSDRIRVLGPDHPGTLTTRSNIAASAGKVGRRREALALWRELLPLWIQVFGEEHPHSQRIRDRVSRLEGEELHPPEPR